MTDRIMLAGLIATGFQEINLTDGTAIGLNGTIRNSGGSVLRLSVETQNARFREDGTDPALSTGVILYSGVTYMWEGYNHTSALKFQRTTGVSTIQVQSYRHVGDLANT